MNQKVNIKIKNKKLLFKILTNDRKQANINKLGKWHKIDI